MPYSPAPPSTPGSRAPVGQAFKCFCFFFLILLELPAAAFSRTRRERKRERARRTGPENSDACALPATIIYYSLLARHRLDPYRVASGYAHASSRFEKRKRRVKSGTSRGWGRGRYSRSAKGGRGGGRLKKRNRDKGTGKMPKKKKEKRGTRESVFYCRRICRIDRQGAGGRRRLKSGTEGQRRSNGNGKSDTHLPAVDKIG